MFMTVVVTSYIVVAPEGFVRFFGDKDIKVIEHIAIIIGCVVSLGCTAGFFMTNKKSNLIGVMTTINSTTYGAPVDGHFIGIGTKSMLISVN